MNTLAFTVGLWMLSVLTIVYAIEKGRPVSLPRYAILHHYNTDAGVSKHSKERVRVLSYHHPGTFRILAKNDVTMRVHRSRLTFLP